MKIKPMLGEFALDHIEHIESSESRALVEHRVPGLSGNYFQDIGTVPNTIVIHGTKHGAAQQLATDHGLVPSELIPMGQDAALVLDPDSPLDTPPTILLRREVLNDPAG